MSDKHWRSRNSSAAFKVGIGNIKRADKKANKVLFIDIRFRAFYLLEIQLFYQ